MTNVNFQKMLFYVLFFFFIFRINYIFFTIFVSIFYYFILFSCKIRTFFKTSKNIFFSFYNFFHFSIGFICSYTAMITFGSFFISIFRIVDERPLSFVSTKYHSFFGNHDFRTGSICINLFPDSNPLSSYCYYINIVVGFLTNFRGSFCITFWILNFIFF